MCVLFLVQYFCLLPILIQIICANITIEFYEEIDSSYKTKKNVKNKKKITLQKLTRTESDIHVEKLA